MITFKVNTIAFVTIIGAILLSSACNRNPTSRNHANWVDSTFNADTVAAEQNTKEKLCFAQQKNAQSKDSTFISVSISGNKVSGIYSWIPFEKDSRKGSIHGTKKGDTLDVVWNYMQEGMKDSLRTVFLLKSGEIKQKPYSINEKNGRQVTDDRSDFSISYQKINCN